MNKGMNIPKSCIFFFFVLYLAVVLDGTAVSNNNQNQLNISTNSPTNFSISSKLGSENGVLPHSSPPVSLEGGSTAHIIPPSHFTTVSANLEGGINEYNNSKRPNLSVTDLYNSLDAGTSSNYNHVSKARKGVNADDSEPLSEGSILGQVSSSVSTGKVDKFVLKDVNNDTSIQPSNFFANKTTPNEMHISSTSLGDVTLKSTESSTQNKTTKSDEMKEGQEQSSSINTSTLPSPKLKPEFTRVDSTSDDQSSFSFTSEGDYVIPVVAILFAAPLLVILGMVLYKKSKEFWERRHYRRMDFLIDGMYND